MKLKSIYQIIFQHRFLTYFVITLFLVLFLSACNENQSTGETLSTQQSTTTQVSQIPSPIEVITSTPTTFVPNPTPTTELKGHHTQVRSTPTADSDELSLDDMTALVATREAHEQALLLTPSPTPTAIVPLTDTGPWLIGRTEQDLILLNRDASGLTNVPIEPDTLFFSRNLQGTLSSSGNWIAVKTGNHPESQSPNRLESPYNLVIQLLQLPSEKISRRIPLLSPELSLLIRQDVSWFMHDFIFPILNSPLFWSPNGRYLAFSAALDGPSSDLYVFDTLTDQVKRLTDGPNQAWVMSWSPDSKWIIHAESTFMLFDHGSTKGRPIIKAVWAAAPDGNVVRKIYDADLDIHQIQGWLSSTTFVEQILRFYPPYRYNIRSVDILSGSSTPLYPCFGSVDAITANGDVIFSSEGFLDDWAETDALREACSNPLPRGQYIFIDKAYIALPEELIAAKWDSVLNAFLLPTNEGIEIRDIIGQEIVDFPGERCLPTVSEDGQWLVFMRPCDREHDESRRVSIFNLEGNLQMKTITKVDKFYWNPDSSGLFLLSGTQLSYFSRMDGETYLLHPDIGVNWLTTVGQ